MQGLSKNLLTATAAVLLCVNSAQAGCSRPIVVPAAPTGNSVLIRGDEVRGVYPDLLRQLGPKYGCEFRFPIVPRARADSMVLDREEGDILIPASRTADRDQRAKFVSLVSVAPAVISMKPQQFAPRSLESLLKSGKRAVIVRRFNYGDKYQAFLAQLEKQGQVEYAPEIANVIRMIVNARADYSIMAPTLFHSTMMELDDVKARVDDLSISVPEDLPLTDSGVYLSTRSLTESDLQLLERLFLDSATGATKSAIWQAFVRYYPPSVLKGVQPHR